SAIRRPGRETVGRSDRNLWLLLIISIQITKDKIERPVGVLLPSFEDRRHVVAGIMANAGQLGDGRLSAGPDRQHTESDHQPQHNARVARDSPIHLFLLTAAAWAGWRGADRP